MSRGSSNMLPSWGHCNPTENASLRAAVPGTGMRQKLLCAAEHAGHRTPVQLIDQKEEIQRLERSVARTRKPANRPDIDPNAPEIGEISAQTRLVYPFASHTQARTMQLRPPKRWHCRLAIVC